MKTDDVFRWRDRIARGSPWGLKTLLPALLLLAGANVANAVPADMIANGDFGTSGSCTVIQQNPLGVNGFDASNPAPGIWIANPTWATFENLYFDNDANNCYARHADNGKIRLIQGVGAGVPGMYSFDYEYVYEYTNNVNSTSEPYMWVLGVNSGDKVISRFPGGNGDTGDGFPSGGTPSDISDWDVLYQRRLAGPCPLTDCANGPALPVPAAYNNGANPPSAPSGGADNFVPQVVTDTFHVPAVYDFFVVVTDAGCNAANANCVPTLRGLDDVSMTLLAADEEGPVTNYIFFDPNAAVVGLPFAITATVDDTGLGDSNIASAEYRIDSGAWTGMSALDGAFDSPTETVTAIAGPLDVGTYNICVRGTDAGGNMGDEDCGLLVVYDPISDRGLNIPVTNECAQFYTLENQGEENEITTLHYGETIIFDTSFHTKTQIDLNGGVEFVFNVRAKGAGVGATSGIKYQLMSNTVVSFDADSDFDPSTFTFGVKAKIVGQAQEIDGYGILNGAQNNADLDFKVQFSYIGGYFSFDVFDFVVQCAGDPWSNLMENKDADTGDPVGRGFGKETNKYSWTMIEYKDQLVDATKNAYYNLEVYANGDGGNISNCIANPPAPGGFEYPDIYWRFACMEIFGHGDPNVWDTDGAEIWALNFKNNRWTNGYNAGPNEAGPEDDQCIDNLDPDDTTCSGNFEFAQGFRDSEIYNGALYVAVDLGAFISGVSNENQFRYPGVALLRSYDGINFEVVPNCGTAAGELCEAQTKFPPATPTNNLSIRALAAYGGKLYIGTLNNNGGKIYTYDDSGGGSFEQVWDAGPQYPIVGELQPYDGDLYIGLGGLLTVNDNAGGNNDYLWFCHFCDDDTVPTDDFEPVADLPDLDPASLFIIKLFVAYDKLFAGSVNFEHGFSFLSYDANTGDFDVIVDGPVSGGMFDRGNIYQWSAAGPINGRIFIGTFKPLPDDFPRLAELYYSDDGGKNWTQYPMPIDWSPLGYGIRDMVVGDKGKSLFLGSATLMPAPDILDIENPLSAGTEVWEIRDTKVASPSTDTVTKGKGKGKNK